MLFLRLSTGRESVSTFTRAVGITPRSLELLSHSGVADRLIAEGIRMDGVCVYRKDALALELPLHSNRTYFPTMIGLSQDRTESIMADVLSSLECPVQYGIALEGIGERADGVIAQFSDGSEAEFDQIIGTDGVSSTVREKANIAYRGIDLDETWSIADVDADSWRHPGKITMVQAEPGVVLVVAPLGPTRYRVVASSEDALKALPLPMNVTRIHREATFKISVRQAETYSRGRIHLAGDAAHSHSPVGGRGMNLGIADAADLSNRIINGGLEGYSAQRHREGAEAIRVTERAAGWFPV